MGRGVIGMDVGQDLHEEIREQQVLGCVLLL